MNTQSESNFRPRISYSLRPVEVQDAEKIIELRTDPERMRYVHALSPHIESQRKWIEADIADPATRYFAVEQGKQVHGFVGLTDINTRSSTAEWGRWVIAPGSMAAVPSVLLVLDYAFKGLEMREVYCRTVEENASVVQFHEHCGLTRVAVLRSHFTLNGEKYDAVEHRLRREDWGPVAKRLSRLSRLAERV